MSPIQKGFYSLAFLDALPIPYNIGAGAREKLSYVHERFLQTTKEARKYFTSFFHCFQSLLEKKLNKQETPKSGKNMVC